MTKNIVNQDLSLYSFKCIFYGFSIYIWAKKSDWNPEYKFQESPGPDEDVIVYVF